MEKNPSNKVAPFQLLFWNFGLNTFRKQKPAQASSRNQCFESTRAEAESMTPRWSVCRLCAWGLKYLWEVSLEKWENWTLCIVSDNTKYYLTSEFTEYGNPHVKIHLSTYVCSQMLVVSMMLTGNCKMLHNGEIYGEKPRVRTGTGFRKMSETCKWWQTWAFTQLFLQSLGFKPGVEWTSTQSTGTLRPTFPLWRGQLGSTTSVVMSLPACQVSSASLRKGDRNDSALDNLVSKLNDKM